MNVNSTNLQDIYFQEFYRCVTSDSILPSLTSHHGFMPSICVCLNVQYSAVFFTYSAVGYMAKDYPFMFIKQEKLVHVMLETSIQKKIALPVCKKIALLVRKRSWCNFLPVR